MAFDTQILFLIKNKFLFCIGIELLMTQMVFSKGF